METIINLSETPLGPSKIVASRRRATIEKPLIEGLETISGQETKPALPAIRMILLPVMAFVLAACGGSNGLASPSYPGPEKSKGDILLFGKNKDGEWITERRYSEAQKRQFEEYEDHLRSEDFDEWLSQGRD